MRDGTPREPLGSAQQAGSTPVVDVMRYGADDTGVCGVGTDEAIRAAIDDAVRLRNRGWVGVVVHFPAGQYCVTHTVTNEDGANWGDLSFRGDVDAADGNAPLTWIESNGGGTPPSSGDFYSVYQPLFVANSAGPDPRQNVIHDSFTVSGIGFVDIDHRCRQLVTTTTPCDDRDPCGADFPECDPVVHLCGLGPAHQMGTSLVQLTSFHTVYVSNVSVQGDAYDDWLSAPPGALPLAPARGGNFCDGLALTSCGAGTLDNVHVDGMGKAGLYIAGGGWGGTILVKNSSFNDSASSRTMTTGAAIANAMNVTLDAVTANGNAGHGMYVSTEGTGPRHANGRLVRCTADSDCQNPPRNADFSGNRDYHCVNGACNSRASGVLIKGCTVTGNGATARLVPRPAPLYNVLGGAGLRIGGVAGALQSSAPDAVTVSNLTSSFNNGAGIGLDGATDVSIRSPHVRSNRLGGVVFWAQIYYPQVDPLNDRITVSGGSIDNAFANDPSQPSAPPAVAIRLAQNPQHPEVIGRLGTVTFSDTVLQGQPPMLDVPSRSVVLSHPSETAYDVLKLVRVTMPVIPFAGVSWPSWVNVTSDISVSPVARGYAPSGF